MMGVKNDHTPIDIVEETLTLNDDAYPTTAYGVPRYKSVYYPRAKTPYSAQRKVDLHGLCITVRRPADREFAA